MRPDRSRLAIVPAVHVGRDHASAAHGSAEVFVDDLFRFASRTRPQPATFATTPRVIGSRRGEETQRGPHHPPPGGVERRET